MWLALELMMWSELLSVVGMVKFDVQPFAMGITARGRGSIDRECLFH